MTHNRPMVSVVIPTRNRLPILRQCLAALEAQNYPHDRFEVIVVADGCSDGTAGAFQNAMFPFAFQILEQAAAGAGTARNRGVGRAKGELILFLDDDVIASPGLIETHVRVHSERTECLVVGPYLFDRNVQGGFMSELLGQFWRRTFETIADPNHRPSHKDVLTGNLSIRPATFARLGGFNPAFSTCLEDYELGVRVVNEGIDVVLATGARARHLETTDLTGNLMRSRNGGRSMLLLASLHPSLLHVIGIVQPDRLSHPLVFRLPRLGNLFSRCAFVCLACAERLRIRRLWLRVHARLKSYWYWRGVRDEVGSFDELRRRVAEIELEHRG